MQKEGTRAISSATPLPPRPSAPRPVTAKPAKVKSFTREEIDRYWRMRRMVEEDHLLFAEKAAARIRAKALKEEDQRRFEELLKEMLEEKEDEKADAGENKELQIGIKDWWTKSKYAYLNQPAIKSMGMGEKKASGLHEACFYLFPPVEPACVTPFGVY
ncbi:uncharacterized protein LOC122038488 [Zingiber officinale]|uniref:uncharacterized protein LOC122038488 n=1 Tax=Zingiber officinale TaxID=94328 RepID=UPI001C4B8609|nr:uncharacterized protein LOC122038488 [Zingiber officinale]XP_042454194.1 uncharacterized protein LOC122038488 [Zingiber officinale]